MIGGQNGRDTIFAISSGALPAAIAIVRISGPAAGQALRDLSGRLATPRQAVLAWLRRADGEPLDRALTLWLPAPRTATGEDLAELHLHGGRATANAVLLALAGMPGLRLAEAGEFTRRALRHGRLDLAEAEGLADLLQAETDGQRRAALRLVEGGLGRLIAGWRERLLALSAGIEAGIEFAEDHDETFHAAPALAAEIAALADEVRGALATPPAERLRDGVRIVVAGPVNEGKSSLVNALCGREAAIATPVPGTTRDLIEVPVVLAGQACLLIDSAGLRTSGDEVEQIGIARAEAAIAGADFLLWLGPPADRPDAPPALVIHARADLPDRVSLPEGADLAVSVMDGRGLDSLRERLADAVGGLLPAAGQIALNQRHRSALIEVLDVLENTCAERDELVLAELFRFARSALDRVVGQAGTEELLDSLFSRFCIGK